MKKMRWRPRAISMTALAGLMVGVLPAAGQGPGAERRYAEAPRAVEKALEKVRPTAKGRLPTLEGFVGATDRALERYRNGYYECAIQASPASGGGTLVRVTAKITAWYSDQDAAKSGYRTLPSNGRLEADLLDRLGETLEPGGAAGANVAGAGDLSTAGQQTIPSGAFHPPGREMPDTPAPNLGRTFAPPVAGGLRGDAPPAPDASAASGGGTTPSEEARAEQHASDLKNLADNLEEILRNQARPENLAAVRDSGTPVYDKPESGGRVLFRAEAQDEFQILEVKPTWVHVQISGVSRGWIRRDQLELPEGFSATVGNGEDPTAEAGGAFQMSRETVTRFAGNWPPLQGKTVKVYYVEPSGGMATSARLKLAFAKSILTTTKADSTPGAGTAAGVVVVFDSVDGGQISATVEDLNEFREGKLSEAAFWRRCSLDPPEAFREPEKPRSNGERERQREGPGAG